MCSLLKLFFADEMSPAIFRCQDYDFSPFVPEAVRVVAWEYLMQSLNLPHSKIRAIKEFKTSWHLLIYCCQWSDSLVFFQAMVNVVWPYQNGKYVP